MKKHSKYSLKSNKSSGFYDASAKAEVIIKTTITSHF